MLRSDVRLAIAVLLFMLVLSFSNPLHLYPLPNYIEELISALGVLLGSAILLWRIKTIRFSLCTLMWLVLGAGFLVSVFLHPAAFSAGKIAYLIYWFLGALALLIGEQIDWDQEDALGLISNMLLWCALVGVVVGLARYFDWHWNGFVLRVASARMMGLIGHSNFFAYLCLVGFFCLAWKWHAKKVSIFFVLFAGFVLIAGVLLSGARSVLVAWAILVVFLMLRRWNFDRYRTALVVGLFCSALMLPFAGDVAIWMTRFGGVGLDDERLAAMVSRGFGSSGRILEWKIALAIFLDHPWSGVGVGNYAMASYIEHLRQGIPSEPGLFLHAHNLILQMAVELGIFGVLWCSFAVLVFSTAAWRGLKIEGKQLPISILMIFGVYSLFEFPLWVMHFLVLNLLLVGCLASGKVYFDARLGKIFSGLLGVVFLVVTVIYVPLVERFYWSFSRYLKGGAMESGDYRFMESMIRDPLLEPAGYMIYFANFQLSPNTLQQERETLERFRNYLPYPPLMARLAFVQVASGDPRSGRETANELRTFYGERGEQQLSVVWSEAERVFPDVDFSVLFSEQG